MEWMRLDHISILKLAILIISISSAGFLFYIRKRSNTAYYLAWTLIGCFLFMCSGFIFKFNPYWLPGWNIYYGSLFIYLGISIILISFLEFAYHFPKSINSLRKEYNIIKVIFIVINITFLFFLIIYGILNMKYNYWELEIVIGLYDYSIIIQFLWILIVFLRKVVFLSDNSSAKLWDRFFKPQGRSAKAIHSFGKLSILPTLYAIFIQFSPPYTPLYIYITYTYLLEMILFFTMVFLVIVFINHSYDYYTIKIKIVGLSLVTMLIFLSFLSFIRGIYNDSIYTNNNLIPDKTTISYRLLDDDQYFIDIIPYEFDNSFGEKVEYTDDESSRLSISLDFRFPLYDKYYNTIQFYNTGTVLLGDSKEGYYGGFTPIPAIIIMDMSLETDVSDGGVYVKNEEDKLTITWYKLPEVGFTEPNTFQLVIKDNGTIKMNISELNPGENYSIMNTTASMIGILPGGQNMLKKKIRFNTDLPYTSAPKSGVYEDYLTDFFDYSHRNIAPFALIMLISSLFVIIVFPRMLRTSLIKPLYAIKEGIEKVNDGDLNVTVNPRYNDEIGYLTESFNKMVISMKKANKLKDDFLANTSHELRTPLNGIIGIAESLIDGALGPLPESAINNLSMIVSSGKRLSSLINDILDFSKLKEGVITLQERPVDIKRNIEVVCLLSKPLISNKNINILSLVPEDIPPVIADQNRLQQILFNLLGNAIKFTSEGEICISVESDGKFVRVSVRDTGIGIPKEQLLNVFKSFEQIDASISREFGGTGLGLSITKNLVELQGGTITVESELGIGSVFSFTIPICSDEELITDFDDIISHLDLSINNEIEIVYNNKVPNKDITILVVDDEPVNLQVLINYLSLSDYQILQARNGEEALKICRSDFKPDLILLDIMMPKMDGYEVCQKLREQIPASELPVILLTAKNQVSDLVDGFDSGANDYITKPFSKSELLARIKTHLELSKINIAYSHFVPHEFLEILHKASIIDVRLGDQVHKEMTIMFSDIRDFTTLSEGLSPKETFDFLNSYLKKIVPVIKRHGGFIDKYIGDAIMALFPGNIEDVINASIEMQKEIILFNLERKKEKLLTIKAGIGLHTGKLILGTIGEQSRMEATVISDAVNLASRVEGLTKLYATEVIISNASFNSLKDKNSFDMRFIGKIQVKGKTQTTEVYEVLNGNSEEQKKLKLKTKDFFNKGLELYYNRDFAEAAVYFNNVLKENPKDKTAQIYRERSASFLVNPPPSDWNGVEALDIK